MGGSAPYIDVAFAALCVVTFASATSAFRLSPPNFARFIGDFRNAALNAA